MARDITFKQELSAEQRDAVLCSAKFRKWLSASEAAFSLSDAEIVFDQVYFFGQKKLGYAMFRVIGAKTPGGDPVMNNIVMLRGDSVAVLPILTTPDGERYTVIVRQPRLAAGSALYAEIPAGMVDEGVFVSKAIEELKEEVGPELEIIEEDLHELLTYHPSPGGCDEQIRLFWAERPVSHDTIDQLNGKRAGNAHEGENIGVDVIPLTDLPRAAPSDGKSLLAYLAYMAGPGREPSPAASTLQVC